jgi:hypothetical protein
VHGPIEKLLGIDTIRYRLPVVIDSFIQWCERMREDFQLDPQIQEQLERRKDKLVLNHTYRQWRTMQKENPTACRLMRFQDDPKISDNENLRLEMETVPL